MNIFKVVMAGLALSLGSLAAFAHHSTNGIYNEETELELVGTVKEWRFINPHPTMTLEVDGVEWDVSYGGSAVAHLMRRGYTAETFKPGDRLRVRGFEAKIQTVKGLLIRGTPTKEDGSPVFEGAPTDGSL